MNAGRASGALSRTRTPLEPEPKPEPEPQPNHRVLGRDGSAGQAGKGNPLGVGEAGPGSWKRACAASVWHPWPGPAPLARTAPWLGRGWGRTWEACSFRILRTAFLSPPSPHP